tara:strand:- start:141 stop:404 length:264 start_codon:yes stop_codon:yes gene_type:complete
MEKKNLEFKISNVIKNIFVETIGIKADEVVENLSYVDYDPWDSVTHMKIVAKIEQSFDLEFEMREIIDMETFEKTIEIVTEKINKSK